MCLPIRSHIKCQLTSILKCTTQLCWLVTQSMVSSEWVSTRNFIRQTEWENIVNMRLNWLSSEPA
jgi:hypothetical protein